MKIIISPAKSLDFETDLPITTHTKPTFVKQSKEINDVLKVLKPADLRSLMSISDSLAELNWQRNKDRKYKFNKLNENVRQAIFAFNGDVYTGLNAYSLTESQINYLQNNLNILSGLYGLLKPLDAIEPYRLEMGIKLPIADKNNLYDFWKDTVTADLNNGFSKGDVLVNLASNEYFKVIDKKTLKAQVITPEFKDYKDGKLKMIGFFAKKARGLMVRYMAENNISNVDDIKQFNVAGYGFDANLSTDSKWVFTR